MFAQAVAVCGCGLFCKLERELHRAMVFVESEDVAGVVAMTKTARTARG